MEKNSEDRVIRYLVVWIFGSNSNRCGNWPKNSRVYKMPGVCTWLVIHTSTFSYFKTHSRHYLKVSYPYNAQ